MPDTPRPRQPIKPGFFTVPDDPAQAPKLLGTRCEGRVVRRATAGEIEAIVPEISGSAWITGEHTFLLDDSDPFKHGYQAQNS